MDVGGGTTDIAVINDGGVQGTKMFGIGGRAYTRGIERDMGVEFATAEKLKVGLAENKVAPKQIPAVEKALKKTLDVWINGVELALGEFTKLDHLPHKILLCGGGSSLDMLMNRLHDSDWYAHLPLTRKPIVQHIHPEEVVGITDLTVKSATTRSSRPWACCAWGWIRYNITVPPGNSVREKIDRILHV
ncbi:MAG: cell division protein FtsA [Candidatus Saccharibacteria bacterium]